MKTIELDYEHKVAVVTGAASGMGLLASKGLAKAGAPHGVRAFCVSPGPVLTRPSMANMKTLLGRSADPSEVVDFILYLASEKGAFVTGTNHVIDGGRLCVARAKTA